MPRAASASLLDRLAQLPGITMARPVARTTRRATAWPCRYVFADSLARGSSKDSWSESSIRIDDSIRVPAVFFLLSATCLPAPVYPARDRGAFAFRDKRVVWIHSFAPAETMLQFVI